MITVGLTGGFGTGKSFVALLFKKLGAKVIDADELAHQAIKKGSSAHTKIVSAFGESVLAKDGSINRKVLGALVFTDKKKLRLLNKIVHPVVIDRIKKIIRTPGKGVLVIDAPLICEAGLSGSFDRLIVVKSSRKKQIARCKRKLNISKEHVCKRMACQMPLGSKIKRADHVIDNDGTRKATEQQVMKVWQAIKKGASVWK